LSRPEVYTRSCMLPVCMGRYSPPIGMQASNCLRARPSSPLSSLQLISCWACSSPQPLLEPAAAAAALATTLDRSL
jgi:hypothetical protein